MTVQRLDRCGRLDRVRKTPQGGILAPANLTRTGVFLYPQEDGTTQRELRLPEEVFSADSLASLRGAPLTVDHPASVNADNWRAVAVGHVDGDARKDGDFVAADIRINDGETIKRVNATDETRLTELSCGYSCDIDKTPGEYEGTQYDSIQRNISYNHVAIGPANWGRAGNDVKLRLDGLHYAKGQALIGPNPIKVIMPDPIAPAVVHTDASVAALNAEIAVLKSEKSTLTTQLAQASDPKRLDGLVAARVELVSAAVKALGGEYKADGKSDLDVMTDTVAKLDPTLKLDGESADFVKAAFRLTTSRNDAVVAAQKSTQLATPVAVVSTEARVDAITSAQDNANYRSLNAWRGEEWLKANPRKVQA